MSARGHEVVLLHPDGGERRLSVLEGQTVLEAAEEAGWALPYSCRSGSCTSCAGRVREGEVDRGEQLVLDTLLVSRGFALLCQARPRSACTILTHQAGAVEGR